MEWASLKLGHVKLVAADARGAIVEPEGGRWGAPRNLIRLVPSGDTFIAEAAKDVADSDEETVPAPFERTSLGKKSRLAWPNGATSIGQYSNLTGRDRNAELLRAFAPSWPELPLTALTVAGVTVERNGTVSGDDAKLVAVAKRAFGAQ